MILKDHKESSPMSFDGLRTNEFNDDNSINKMIRLLDEKEEHRYGISFELRNIII